MDLSGHGIERIWLLLSTQYVEHSPRLVYQICELYIDDVLIHSRDLETFLANVRKAFERLREFNIVVNPEKTKLGLAEVEYVGLVISATGTSFTEEKRLKVLQFPLPETQKKSVAVYRTRKLFS